jgi:polysaccharide pyruvyl transferase WcaK-like protein
MDLVSDYFTTFRSITTRDELSFRSLEDFGAGDKTELRQAVDPVFGLFPFAERPVRTGPIQMNVILSTIFRWFGAEGNPAQEEAIRDWAEILSGIQASGINVKLYPFSPSLVGNYDWVRAEYVHRLAPTLPIVDSRSIPYMEVIGTLCDADLIVTDRYHGAILSAIRGIPFVTVCQDPKLRNIAAELDQPSLEPGAHDKEHVKKILSEALSGLDIQRKRLLDARCFIPDAHQTLIQEVKKIRI